MSITTARTEHDDGSHTVTCGDVSLPFNRDECPMEAHMITHATWAMKHGKPMQPTAALQALIHSAPRELRGRLHAKIQQVGTLDQFKLMCSVESNRTEDIADVIYTRIESAVVGACADDDSVLLSVLDWFQAL